MCYSVLLCGAYRDEVEENENTNKFGGYQVHSTTPAIVISDRIIVMQMLFFLSSGFLIRDAATGIQCEPVLTGCTEFARICASPGKKDGNPVPCPTKKEFCCS